MIYATSTVGVHFRPVCRLAISSAPQQEARYEAVSLGGPALLVRLLADSLATAPATGSHGACMVASLVCKALARLAAVRAGRLDLARAGGIAALAAALRAGCGMPEAAECLQVGPCQASSSVWRRQVPNQARVSVPVCCHAEPIDWRSAGLWTAACDRRCEAIHNGAGSCGSSDMQANTVQSSSMNIHRPQCAWARQ